MLVSLAISFARTVAAQAPPTARMTYVLEGGADAACPDERALRDLVIARLGRDPFVPEGPPEAMVRVASDGTTLSGRLEIIDVDGGSAGARELAAPLGECDELVASFAAAIAIALDPATTVLRPREVEPPAARRATTAPTDPEHPPALEAETAPAPAAPSREHGTVYGDTSAWSLALGPAASVGRLPSLSFGGEVGAAFAWRRLKIVARAFAETLPHPAALEDADIEGTILGGRLLACFVPQPWLDVCALTSLAHLEASNAQTPGRSASTLVPELGLRLAFTWLWSRNLGVEAHVEATLPLVRVSIHSDAGPLWSAPLLAAGAGGSLVVIP